MVQVIDGKLAIEGGVPVRRTRLPYGRQTIDEDDIQAVVAALRSDYLTTGPRIDEFEEAFAAAVGSRFAVAVSSGTAALHAAAAASGIDEHAEVVTTPLTFAATANCVLYQGGRPVFADVRADTLTLDAAAARQAMTPRTRAIITVDYAGQPSDLDELADLAHSAGGLLIEDACHALGAKYRDRRVGQIADLTVFSLHPVKHITTGEGGVVTTDDPTLAARLRRFRTHGISVDYRTREREGAWYYEVLELGYNYRLTDLQCALGLSQLRKLGAWLERRAEIVARYHGAFAGCAELELPVSLPDRQSAWHLYVVRLNLDRLSVGRATIFKALVAENIGVNVHYIPVPWHPYYARLGYVRGGWPRAESAYERMLTLPLFPAMRDADADDVVTAVQKVITHYRR